MDANSESPSHIDESSTKIEESSAKFDHSPSNMSVPNNAPQSTIDAKNLEAIDAMIQYDPWEEIGFSRPLGGFFYNFFFMILTMVASLLLISVVFSLLYPYPQIQGYNSIAGGFYALIFQIFDVGTAFGIKRFIAEYRVKDPNKMLEYVRFFIWYQMFTGIFQVLLVSVFILQYARFEPSMSYLTWIFLIICQKQWPGMLGTYSEILNGLQKFNKARLLRFFSSDIFQNVTNIIFILLGRWWGMHNPVVGDLMGGAIGYAIGSYVDDFFSMVLAAYYFNKEMAPFGLTYRDTFRTYIGKDVIKQCLWFGFQVSIVPIINTAVGTAMLLMYYSAIPQYTAWLAIVSIASGLSGIINVGDFELTPALAESYMNGKKTLSRFYISNSMKWNGFFMCLLLTIVASFIPMILKVILQLPGLEFYQSAVIFIPFLLIHSIFKPYIDILNPILVGCLHIGFYTFLRVSEEGLQLFFVWFFLFFLRLQDQGPIGIAIIFGWEHFFPRLIKMIVGFIYVNKKIFKIKIYWMQTFVIPLLSAAPIAIFSILWDRFVFDFLIATLSVIPAAIITILIGILVMPLFIYLPLTGILGCWDDFQLKTFRKAVKISGPSKIFFGPFLKMVELGVKLNPKWHNKFPIPWKDAEKEIQELSIMKVQNIYVNAKKVDPKEFFLKISEEKKQKKSKTNGTNK